MKSNEIIKQESTLAEMSNIRQRDHYIDTDVIFHVLQPGTWHYKGHGPRLKLFKGNYKQAEIENKITGVQIGYELTDVNILYNGLDIKSKEKRLIIDHIERYRLAYIVLWLDVGMSNDQLVDYFELIDSGRSAEVLKKIHWLK